MGYDIHMRKRRASHRRTTKETDISIRLALEGMGKGDVKTPVPFFSHLLDAFAKHGGFDLRLRSAGDLEVDQHHIIEDLGIALGEAFEKALGDKKGINRAGYFVFPMDEALALVSVDISGRAHLEYEATFKRRFAGDLDTDVLAQFFYGFVRGLKATLHVYLLAGKDDHHRTEAMFKAFAKAMKTACSRDKRLLKELPSTKGKI